MKSITVFKSCRKNVFNDDEINSYLPIFQELQEAIENLPSEDNFQHLLDVLCQNHEDILGVNILLSVGLNASYKLSLRSLYITTAVLRKIQRPAI